ncbi:MAG: outer membrane protein assembly factor BamE [Gemmobacter sp.]|uniref:outer membrane protein assembly factor BamE n=1 Tax=Gemmobacter sp. TaxID=1898957 RepID=UPI001A3F525A|nr:outer membrane protein assembly factor BamE [Gemmobacter sp.]MBL8562134.1 outer membrane protein assembly factor BamE [Gemmobacter sp.]
MQARFVRLGRRVAPWLAGGILSLSLMACAPIYRNHGYIPEQLELDAIQIGASREEVATAIGRPSASGLLNDVGWFYVQSRWEHKGGRTPKEIDRQVVAISFSEAGTVTNIERFGLERGRVVALSRRVTETNIKGMGFLRQLFGSIGRLRADQLVD